jgi:MOSC domain-containing protein YiiM
VHPSEFPGHAGTFRAGRVLRLNISAGGVPKLPVAAALVGTLGFDGDGHTDRTVHGGPHRAVCLYSIEAIGRLRSDGHPVEPGSLGENLTLEGIELGELSPGDRLVMAPGRLAGSRDPIGPGNVVLEIASPCNPCPTIRGSFRAGRISRASVRVHPADSRVYARVLQGGWVHAGDAVRVLPPLPDSAGATHALLDRLDDAERASAVLVWHSAREAGVDIRVVDDGDLAMAATPDVPVQDFNTALGLRQLPHLVPDIAAFFARNGCTAWLDAAEPPWADAVAEEWGAILSAKPSEVADALFVEGLSIRRVPAEDAAAWQGIVNSAFGFAGVEADTWAALASFEARDPRFHLLVADLEGDPVAAAGLFVHRRVGVLGPGAVLQHARRRGIHAALIAARARLAAQLRCDLLTSQAELGGPSERNQVRMGLRRVWRRGTYRLDPGAVDLLAVAPR